MINKNEIGLYVMLAMKNLYFTNIQTENVVSEVQRLLKNESVEEVKLKLEKKGVKNRY
ncbi:MULTISPECIES: hypothetical protein [Enterococcus]|uniref:hypothetical protein n=1 Tax=Enterococcus TaxID=1350 RepID=UPI001788C38A|nr:hypothetical protein [Enterococcus avium]HBI1562653.1 hypothetical protein [Enterococcus faecalis]HBI1565793.1 hypothetical protein [Enterococcus faecalis]HBI1718064.1 hypothetical protein [Enterococcus faecalis]HBI1721042.1 hypothetical protein [Enterococcus faecalis]HBI1724058.1 hypothetical protein [Enterococcus faecalis]